VEHTLKMTYFSIAKENGRASQETFASYSYNIITLADIALKISLVTRTSYRKKRFGTQTE
jgi:hypothetical protein